MDDEYADLLQQLEQARDHVHSPDATDADRQEFKSLQQQVADRRVYGRMAREAEYGAVGHEAMQGKSRQEMADIREAVGLDPRPDVGNVGAGDAVVDMSPASDGVSAERGEDA